MTKWSSSNKGNDFISSFHFIPLFVLWIRGLKTGHDHNFSSKVYRLPPWWEQKLKSPPFLNSYSDQWNTRLKISSCKSKNQNSYRFRTTRLQYDWWLMFHIFVFQNCSSYLLSFIHIFIWFLFLFNNIIPNASLLLTHQSQLKHI